MFSSTRMITAVFAALALASTGFAAPAPADGDVSSLSARAVAPTSRFVIYSDNWVTGVLPPATQLKVSVICIRTISFPGTITNIRLHVGLQRRRALIPHPPRRTRPGRQVRRPLPRRQDSKAERIPQRRHQDRRVRIRRDRHPHHRRCQRRQHGEHDGAVGEEQRAGRDRRRLRRPGCDEPGRRCGGAVGLRLHEDAAPDAAAGPVHPDARAARTVARAEPPVRGGGVREDQPERRVAHRLGAFSSSPPCV